MGFCGEMHHLPHVVTGEKLVHQGAVADVAAHEGVVRLVRQIGQVFRVTGIGELVEVDYLQVRAGGQQEADEVGADEAATAGDEYCSGHNAPGLKFVGKGKAIWQVWAHRSSALAVGT